MIDVHEASVGLRILGTNGARRPGTLSPDPWHFSLFANSMTGEQGLDVPRRCGAQEQGPDTQRHCGMGKQGDATTMTASPMLPDRYGARGACRQSGFPNAMYRVWSPSPILRSSESRLPARPSLGKGQAHRISHAIGPKRQMPGVWGQSPQGARATEEWN